MISSPSWLVALKPHSCRRSAVITCDTLLNCDDPTDLEMTALEVCCIRIRASTRYRSLRGKSSRGIQRRIKDERHLPYHAAQSRPATLGHDAHSQLSLPQPSGVCHVGTVLSVDSR
ncbi:hypothetical protein AXF42_Ash012830 [Apostasia shenzhenica]|uniref:Uncharacterized protein n=1 Tax=Apostasia shenzhenica TaxID=1088818 RepID=A0A2I0AMB5_9ASPA|nr:hypothetical protein AXF42_Ash012830 [Apostasia shenzhenica]